MYRIHIEPRTLHFKQPAGTSRGVYTTRRVWYLHLTSDSQPGREGIGECAPLPNLSCDDLPHYEQLLSSLCQEAAQSGIDYERLRPYPSILFGLETAFHHFERVTVSLWDTPFSRGEQCIPINGLIWMGSYTQMLSQIEAKMQAGFRCIKLKIGAIHFEEELSLLKMIRRHFSAKEIELRVDANGAFSPAEALEKLIRRHFSAKEIELRVDANGAFSPAEALEKLQRLSELDLHSIEQPIRAGQWDSMAHLSQLSPLPIALDEELIGVHSTSRKKELLETIHPQYIILKPSLHGGLRGSQEWIAAASQLGIGWWITSALESNIGLNAIAQWCATLHNPLPQGLGTGALFTDNIPMPLEVRGDELWVIA